MKFWTGVRVPDVITHATFSDHRFWGFEDSRKGVEFPNFPLISVDFRKVVVLETLWHYVESV